MIALGGGVVGDLAGFAAAIYLAGSSVSSRCRRRCLRWSTRRSAARPVSTPSFGKNLTGAFHQPSGVLIDPNVLSTLPSRELTAGFLRDGQARCACRAGSCSTATTIYLPDFGQVPQSGSERANVVELIKSNVEFKASIVAADERESSKRRDSDFAKNPQFWPHSRPRARKGHKLQAIFRHGEAVGYGILFAAELSKNLALCDEKDVNLLHDVVHRVGTLPSLAGIDPDEVLAAFRSDKKVIGGELQMVLLKGIGKPVIVSEKDIPRLDPQEQPSNSFSGSHLPELTRQWNNSVKRRDSERGSAGVKLVIVLAVIVLAANAGYNYVPVAYDAESLKSDMETAVLQGLAMPGKINPVDNVKERIQKSIVRTTFRRKRRSM